MDNNCQQYFLRNVIGGYLKELGSTNEKIVVVNADLMKTCRNESFVESFPERSFNVGIAEQNMISFASGLAREGFIPFAFSMAPFISMRACEQCRTDVAYENINVKLISTYAGCSGGISGATHWSIEDCGIMSSMPNMVVIELCDPNQAISLLNKVAEYNGPVYVRSGVEPVAKIYSDEETFEIGRANIVCDGDDGAFICSGITTQFAVSAAKVLKEKYDKRIRVVDMSTIKPIDIKSVLSAANTGKIIVAQDHNVIGGLGSMVATVLAENNINTQFKILGINDKFVPMAHAQYLYDSFGYGVKGLINAMLDFINIKE